MKELVVYTNKLEKYLWHQSSPKHRESILKNGLIPQAFEKSSWKSKDLYYPPAVFVNNHSNYADWFYAEEGNWNADYFCAMDCWRIDTSHLKNTWYYDTNLYQDGGSLFTMETIAPDCLELFKPHNIACIECNTLICGLSIEKAFNCNKTDKRQINQLIHHICLKEREDKRFDLEELACINGLNKLKNLPAKLKEEIELLIVH